MLPEDIDAATVEDIASVIENKEATSLAEKIHALGSGVMSSSEPFPSTLATLKELGADDIVARRVMQHVFGSNELVISIHCRKIVCALDMFDWEETGADKKDTVKMVKVQAKAVRNSLVTWLPKGEGRQFQDALDSLGEALGTKRVGSWGKVTATVNKHYAPKQKKKLIGMLEDISRFYKATKSGGRRKNRA